MVDIRHWVVLCIIVRGNQTAAGPHRAGHDRADELAVAAKREAEGA